MHKNPVWLGFLGLIFAITCYFMAVASMEVYQFNRLESQTEASIEKWSVVEVSTEIYSPKAKYSFNVDDKQYSGETLFDFRVSRNPESAQLEIRKLSKETWTAWYDPDDPEVSVLDKRYPIWPVLTGVLMAAIFIYFVWLGFYVGRKTRLDETGE